jgi:hypothetical protein
MAAAPESPGVPAPVPENEGSPAAPGVAPELPVPMPFPLLLDEAVRRTRQLLPAVYLPFAAAMAVLAATGATVVTVVNHGMVNSRDPTQMLANGCSAMLLYLPLGVLYQVLGAAMVQATVEALLGRRPAFGRALRFAVRPAVLGALLLVQVCTIASAMACLVPVLFIGPLLGLVVPAMAVEGLTGTEALRRSAQLTRYNPIGTLLASPRLKILALFVLVAVVSKLVGVLPELPLTVVGAGSILRRLAAGESPAQALTTWTQVPVAVVEALLTTPIQIFSSLVLSLLFFDLRARREGDDLRRAVAGLTSGLDAGVPPLPPSLPIMMP